MYGDARINARSIAKIAPQGQCPDRLRAGSLATKTTQAKGSIMLTLLTQKGSTRLHPMMIIAAIAVIVFCLAGTAAIMGWLPSSVGSNTKNLGNMTEADRQALMVKPDGATPTPQLAQQAPMPATPKVAQAAPPAERAPEPAREAHATQAKNWCSNCGNVESVRDITQRGQGSGAGAAGGAIIGGLLGNQVGSGHGRQLATVAGAVGGAVAGNQIEGNMKATHSYEIRVRMDDGSSRTFHQNNAPGWHTGDRVRVVKGELHSVN
jgi:outer membrane lipoprotein SlyB